MGIARGTDSTASIQFNVNANRRDRETNYALFSETLDILLKAWGDGAFSHEGRFYTYPVPGLEREGPGDIFRRHEPLWPGWGADRVARNAEALPEASPADIPGCGQHKLVHICRDSGDLHYYGGSDV